MIVSISGSKGLSLKSIILIFSKHGSKNDNFSSKILSKSGLKNLALFMTMAPSVNS